MKYQTLLPSLDTTNQDLWKPTSTKLKIEKNIVPLWKIFAVENESYINQLKKNLSKDELNRAEKFHHKKDELCYITARGALKQILSNYINIPTNDISFSYNEFGKPYLSKKINSLDIQFNISHSNNFIIFAFTLNHTIGVDIEKIHPKKDISGIAKLVFSIAEYNQWLQCPPENKLNLFYQLWTYKEAIIKAIGKGFSYNTKSFTIETLEKDIKIIFHDKKGFKIPEVWTIKSIPLEDTYYAAFATTQEISQIKYYRLVL